MYCRIDLSQLGCLPVTVATTHILELPSPRGLNIILNRRISLLRLIHCMCTLVPSRSSPPGCRIIIVKSRYVVPDDHGGRILIRRRGGGSHGTPYLGRSRQCQL